jgi:hypothetical protein
VAAALQGKTRGGTRPRVAGRLVLKGGGLQGSTSHQSQEGTWSAGCSSV